MSIEVPKSIVNQSTSIKVSNVKGKLQPGASRKLEFVALQVKQIPNP